MLKVLDNMLEMLFQYFHVMLFPYETLYSSGKNKEAAA